MSSNANSLTAEDLDLIQRPLHGFLYVAGGPNPPQPRPVWFEATAEGTIQLFTGPETLKVRRLRRDPRASIVVAAPVGERERWVSVAGHTTVMSDHSQRASNAENRTTSSSDSGVSELDVRDRQVRGLDRMPGSCRERGGEPGVVERVAAGNCSALA